MKIPTTTYRLQFNSDFDFTDAAKVLPYLADLGVTDVYASPIFQANPGSAHGYDVTDFAKINPELGGEEGFIAISDQTAALGLGWIQDIVPNHMAYISDNPYISDVFENGPGSRYAHLFDFFSPGETGGSGRQILAPFLGKLYGQALRDHEIIVRFGPNGFTVNYYEIRFPLLLESYARLLSRGLKKLEATLGRHHPDFLRYLATVRSLVAVPEGGTSERAELTRVSKRMLWDLYSQNPQVKEFIDRNIDDHNGGLGEESRGLMDGLLAEQTYRLSFWKVADEEINYRRFFSINSLISLRVEEEDVFDLVHALPLRLAREGRIQGLRIDHLDGLYDPKHYLRRVREHFDGYMVAEKILMPDERLPDYFLLQGTTGYDFGAAVNRLFVPPENEESFSRVYQEHTGDISTFPDLLQQKRLLILMRNMVGSINNLAQLLKTITSRDPDGRDITPYSLRRAMVAVMSEFPVYRTYICPHVTNPSDRQHITAAVAAARDRQPDLMYELNFLESFLLEAFQNQPESGAKNEIIDFVMRFQQFTGPLMAKGMEDTAFYVYNRLLSRNEVGDDPSRFGLTLSEFHEFIAARAAAWPHTMNLTMSHDSKRGEDLRARLNVLAEIPEEWGRALARFRECNRDKKSTANGAPMPDANDEYFIYQTLLGAWPSNGGEENLGARVREYLVKAVREAKVHTAWLHPDLPYEEACTGFVNRLLEDSAPGGFLETFLPLQRRVAFYGVWNALSQALIKAAAPGVPDYYQGSELWDFRLVDPDNRRPVDFEKRASSLYDIRDREREDLPGLLAELLRRPDDGRVKMFLVSRSLRARKQQPDLFTRGEYVPLVAGGKNADEVIAFARRINGRVAVCVAPRFLTRVVTEGQHPIGPVWGDTRVQLPAGFPESFEDAVSGRPVRAAGGLPVAELFAAFPAALLISNGG